jgi:hypothetical protein
MPTVRALRAAVPLLVAGLVLSGCTGSEGDDGEDGAQGSAPASGSELPTGDPTDQSTDVAFTACGAGGFACEGEIDGTPYEFRLPEAWNGSLLIYSHGLRPVDPVAADGPAFEPIAEAAPGLASGVDIVATTLVEQGYALVGAGTPVGGWAVDEAVDAITTVREAFVTNIGVPNRIYTWGQSLGGLAALRSGEANDWVSGSVSMCGLLGGLNPNMDLALDAAVAVKALLEPDLILTGYETAEQARAEYDRAMEAVTGAAVDPTGEGLTALQVIAATAEVPTQTRTSEGTTLDQQRVAIVENLGRVLARSTLERFRVEEDLRGNPSTNVGVNYGARVTADDAALIDAMAGAEGTTLTLVRRIAAIPGVEADPAARAAADAQYPPPAALTKPNVTLHTAVDPVAILANETLYGQAAAQASGQDIRWLSINVSNPPSPYPADGVAPYGAGHCSFTGTSLVGSVRILDDWVRLGRFPTWAGNTIALGAQSGFAGPNDLPAWPPSPTTGAN